MDNTNNQPPNNVKLKDSEISPKFEPLKKDAESLKSHVNNLIAPNVVPHAELLKRMLKKVEYVDFKSEANLEDDEKINRRTYVVITIDKVLGIAINEKWQMCVKYEKVYLYNGAYWKDIPTDDLKRFLKDAAIKMGVPDLKARFHEFPAELMKQFFSEAILPTPEPNGNEVRINLKNGTYTFSEKKRGLRSPDPKDFLTSQLPFEYNPQAIAPQFEKFLNEVLPDKSLQKILLEFIGYVFINPETLKLEKALMLIGGGSNGKSVVFDIIFTLLGSENILTNSISSLTDSTRQNYRADLADKLLNYCSEFNNIKDKSIFKAIVSGEVIQARQLYKQAFNFRNKCKLMFNANEFPESVEHTHAYFRRFLIIPFDITISKEKQDKHLAQRIITNELSGIFNLVIEGLERLTKQNGFTESDKADKALGDFKEQSDSVRMFVNEKEYKPTNSDLEYKSLTNLYAEYRTFCIDDGYKPTGKKKFKKRLEKAGFQSAKKMEGQVIFMTL